MPSLEPGDAHAMSNRHDLSIRTADGGDIDGIAELLGTAGQAIARRQLAPQLGALLDQPRGLVDRRRMGPAIRLDRGHAVLKADLKVGWVSALVVDPVCRRNGIARLLLKAASQAARSAGRGDLRLTTPTAPNELRAFCLATGFSETGAALTRSPRKGG